MYQPRKILHAVGNFHLTRATKKLVGSQLLKATGKPALAQLVERSAKRSLVKGTAAHAVAERPAIRNLVSRNPRALAKAFRLR